MSATASFASASCRVFPRPGTRRRARTHVRAAADAAAKDLAEAENDSKKRQQAVEAALRSADKAAKSAESSLDRIPHLPSAQVPNRAVLLLKKVVTRTIAAAAVASIMLHLLLYQAAPPDVRIAGSAVATMAIVLGGFFKRSLDESGAAAAFGIAFTTAFASYAFAGLLVAFFVSSSMLTRLSSSMKARLDGNHKRDGQRDWLQVVYNGLVPALLAVLYTIVTSGVHAPFLHAGAMAQVTALQAGVLGYFACCCGDTWASEVGILSERSPRFILTGKRVRKGTNGAVSGLGTAVSAAGGLLVGAVGWLFAVVGHGATFGTANSAAILALGTAAGVGGSLIDSLSGATLQYSGYDTKLDRMVSRPGEDVEHISGVDILSNGQNNVLSATVTAALTAWAAVYILC